MAASGSGLEHAAAGSSPSMNWTYETDGDRAPEAEYEGGQAQSNPRYEPELVPVAASVFDDEFFRTPNARLRPAVEPDPSDPNLAEYDLCDDCCVDGPSSARGPPCRGMIPRSPHMRRASSLAQAPPMRGLRRPMNSTFRRSCAVPNRQHAGDLPVLKLKFSGWLPPASQNYRRIEGAGSSTGWRHLQARDSTSEL